MDLILIKNDETVIFYRNIRSFYYKDDEIYFNYGKSSDSFTSVAWHLGQIKTFKLISEDETKVNLGESI